MENRRLINLAGAALCAAMWGYALFAQFQLHLEPCPLCIFSRVTVLAIGVAFLLAALWNPPRRVGRWVVTTLIALSALACVGVSARHLYIQAQPPGSVPACGAPLDVLLQMFHVWTVVFKVFHGGGECAVVNWSFLGLSMPGWVLVCAVLLGGIGVAVNAPRRTQYP